MKEISAISQVDRPKRKRRLKEKAGATERRNRKGCEEQLEQYRIGRRAGLEALSHVSF